MKRAALTAGLLLLASQSAIGQPAPPTFVEFESGPVRPVALSPDGSRLFVTNTPDNRLEVFNVNLGGTLTAAFSVPVGMEPVALAARSNTEVWVVNQLSDSVSIVDLSSSPPRVARTLIVGDEPRDIVFAGTNHDRAFITTAHRGQQRKDTSISGVTGAGDPQLTTAGLGRADVWVFDATNLGAAFGGTPTRILTFFADTPRALAATADGSTVYVAAFHSGNQTTEIAETATPDSFATTCSGNVAGAAGTGIPGPGDNSAHATAPFTGIVVKRVGTSWVDSLGCTWNSSIPFTLPDHDVFRINANTLASAGSDFDHVGTILFNMAINPVSGRVYVTNTESPNLTRFEGPGTYGGSTVQGHLSEARITVLNPSTGGVDPQHLNKHINYSLLHTTAGANHTLINAQAQHSLATPLQPVVSSNGATLYVPAFGSSKIGVFTTAAIEDPNFETNFDPTTASANYITTSGGGPAGIALDETNNRLYVLTRFDNTVYVINPTTKATVETHALFNPEPASVVTGRPFLYDAQLTSANGEASCSSCHIFGDFDSLSWNLGNPDDAVSNNPQPSASPNLPVGQPPGSNWTTFHPMKGPMSTQTLRGMSTHGGEHWRGDRTSGFFGQDPCNNSSPSNSPCDERLSFDNFIVAFEGLVGKQGPVGSAGFITTAQMQSFRTFILQVFEPPNPVRALDNKIDPSDNSPNNAHPPIDPSAAAQAGFAKYTECPTAQCTFNGTGTSDTVEDCEGCHQLNPALGFFGTAGQQTFEGEPQNAKVPHLRNAYTKIGMFSVAGNQVRGAGFLHDGAVDTLVTFLSAPVFTLTATDKTNLEQFILRYPSDLAPIVGQQVTLTSTNSAVAGPRIDLMIVRAGQTYASWTLGGAIPECDLIVKGNIGSTPVGWVRQSSGQFRDDFHTLSDPAGLWNDAQVRALATSQGPLTYTCAPPGSGTRMGVDRNLDGTPDGLPEPGALLSLASGAAAVAALTRRRRAQRTTIA
jgi:DNA-binding beta-propeller fold protein YncE